MSSISSLTSSSSSSSSTSTTDIYNGHIFGLASGLDVDSIVSGLTTDIQDQIDKADQNKQTLQWKQTDYQSIVTALNTFDSAYLEMSGSGSITGDNALQTYSASSNNSAVTATAQEGCDGLSTTLTVYQNATTASLKGSSLSKALEGQDISSIDISTLENTGFTMTVDGVSKVIKLSSGVDSSTLVSSLNTAISNAFGWTSGNEEVQVADDSGKIQFSTANSYNAAFSISGVTTTSGSSTTTNTDGVNALFGTTDTQSSAFNRNLTVDDLLGNSGLTVDSTSGTNTYNLTVNGQTVQLDGSDNIFTAIKKINAAGTGVSLAYSSTTGMMAATATQSGAAGNFSLGDGAATSSTVTDGSDISTAFLEALGFSSDQVSGTSTGSLSGATAGQNAIVSLDGGTTLISRSSNSFTLDNVNYTINGTVTDTQTAAVTFSQDTSSAVKTIQNFVSAYNVLLAAITTYTNTKPDNDYKPLTDAQKEKMSDSQITDWNTKASAGVLFNDDTLNDLEQELRDMVNASVTTSDGTTISLADLGIRESTENTGTDDTTPGQLVFDNDSTDTLVSMLQNHASEVQDLFTQQSSTTYLINDTSTKTTDSGVTENTQTYRKYSEGLAYRLQDIVKDYTKTGSTASEQGKLISLLGSSTDGNQLDSIYDQITDVNTQITDLNTKMTTKKNALYAKFSTLETFMAKMNSQSGMLSSLSSGS